MNAMNSAKTSSGRYDGPQPKLIVLKLRNRIVLTISAAGTSTTAMTVAQPGYPVTGYGHA